MSSHTYVCADCGASTNRHYRVRYFLKSCDAGCGFVKFVRNSLLDKLREVPTEVRPDDWSSLAVDQKLAVAFKAGVVKRTDLL